jgi:hypothetical protein
MHMSDTTDALEFLTRSEGWRILCDTARKEWATRERVGRKNALSDTDDKRALDKLRQITAAQEAVEWLLNLPTEELARLKRQEVEPTSTPTWRPPSSLNVGEMSRRGSL